MSERNDMNLTPEELRLQEAVRGLGEVRPDDAFRERLRAEFVSGEIENQENAEGEAPAEDNIVPLDRGGNRNRLWVAAIPVLAAILAFVFFMGGDPGWELKSVTGTGTIAIDGQTVDAADFDAVADLIEPGARIVVPATAELELILGDVMVFGIIRDSDVTIPAAKSGDGATFTANVTHGELLVKTGPGFPGEHLLITTSEGRIELTGTTIAVNKGDGFTCVCVLEGTALIGKDQADLEEVGAGYRKVMFASDEPSMIVDIEPGHEKDLTDFEARNEEAFGK
jgi:ferric-dicitrate binding protein FerR (iron transport regulator)